MKPNPVAGNVLGTMGTICWTGQLIPQVWKNYRDKKTIGLSPWLMLVWGVSSAFLGVYAILQHLNIPLQVQPQLFGFLTLLSWGQCLYYDPHKSKKKSVLITIITMVVVGGLELLLVFVSRPAYERVISAPVKLYGVLSAVLIGLGLLPQYWEIYVHKEVKGISYTFILIDMLGGLFNDLSLMFAEGFDGLAAASYTIVIVMDSVIIFAAIILNPRARKRRRLEAAAVAENAGASVGDADVIERGRAGFVPLVVGPDEGPIGRGVEKDGEGGDEKFRGIPIRQVYSEPPSTFVSSTVVDGSEEGGGGGRGGLITPSRRTPTPTLLVPHASGEKNGKDKGAEMIEAMGDEKGADGHGKGSLGMDEGEK